MACFWSIRGGVPLTAPRTQRILPDGCMDVLFNLADASGAETPEPRPPSYVVGTMTRPLEVSQAGAVDVFGVRFRPGGITPFVRVHAPELTDGFVPLEDIWGGDADEICQRLQDIPDTAARVVLVDGILQERLRRAKEGDALIRAAAGLAEGVRGRVTVAELVRATGLGRRQLERRFLAAVGVPPKTACRVLRFQGALAHLATSPSLPLSHVALESGYHDQAHFTRDFKALAGVTPGTYRQELLTPP